MSGVLERAALCHLRRRHVPRSNHKDDVRRSLGTGNSTLPASLPPRLKRAGSRKAAEVGQDGLKFEMRGRTHSAASFNANLDE